MFEIPALSASNFRLAIRSIMSSTRGIMCVSHFNALLTPLPSYTKRYPLNEPSFKGGFYKHCGFWRRRRRCPGR